MLNSAGIARTLPNDETQSLDHRHRRWESGLCHDPGDRRNNRVDVFFIPDKGTEKADLSRVRRLIIDRHIRDRPFRTVEYRVPSRCRESDDYEGAVSAWHADIGETFGQLILEELSESEVGAFLVWGDPTLYDSTLRILEHLRAKGDFELDYDIIPGISSVQALAAQHRVAINAIGRAVLITNGRELAEGFPNNVDSVMVLLNADKALHAPTASSKPTGAPMSECRKRFWCLASSRTSSTRSKGSDPRAVGEWLDHGLRAAEEASRRRVIERAALGRNRHREEHMASRDAVLPDGLWRRGDPGVVDARAPRGLRGVKRSQVICAQYTHALALGTGLFPQEVADRRGRRKFQK